MTHCTSVRNCSRSQFRLFRMGILSSLYKIARIANDVSVLASGNPKRVGKRVVNKAIGRSAVKLLYLR